MPPFTPTHTPLELIAIVRTVSLHAAPDAPRRISGRRWDDGLTAAGHPGVPRAFSIAKRLGIGWAQVLHVAHHDPADALRMLSVLQADKGRKGYTLDGVFLAMRQAAHRLQLGAISRTDYQRARELILASTRRTRHAATAARAMPTLNQIEEILDRHELSWAQACTQAGLAAPARPAGRASLTLEQAIHAFIDDVGKMPRYGHDLRRWAAGRQVSFHFARYPAAAVRAAIDTIAAERARAGQPALDDATPADIPRAPATSAHPPKRRVDWTRDTLIDGMAIAVRLLGLAGQLSQRSLKRLAAEHPELAIPSYTTVHRHLRNHHPGESWEQWCREAEQRAWGRRSDGRGET